MKNTSSIQQTQQLAAPPIAARRRQNWGEDWLETWHLSRDLVIGVRQPMMSNVDRAAAEEQDGRGDDRAGAGPEPPDGSRPAAQEEEQGQGQRLLLKAQPPGGQDK